jgi:hypothetical protein
MWRVKSGLLVVLSCYCFERVISIVETILDLFSPSLGGISAVPMAILLTSGFQCYVFVVALRESCDYRQHIAHGGFVSNEDDVLFTCHFYYSLLFWFVVVLVTSVSFSPLTRTLMVY